MLEKALSEAQLRVFLGHMPYGLVVYSFKVMPS